MSFPATKAFKCRALRCEIPEMQRQIPFPRENTKIVVRHSGCIPTKTLRRRNSTEWIPWTSKFGITKIFLQILDFSEIEFWDTSQIIFRFFRQNWSKTPFQIHDTSLDQPHVAQNPCRWGNTGSKCSRLIGSWDEPFLATYDDNFVEFKWHKCVICKLLSPIRVVYYKMLFSTCSTGLQALVGAYETLRNPEKLAAEEMQQRVTNTTSNEMPTIVKKCGETCYAPFFSHMAKVYIWYGGSFVSTTVPLSDWKIPLLRRQEYDESQRGPKEFFLLTAHCHNDTWHRGMPLRRPTRGEYTFEIVFNHTSVHLPGWSWWWVSRSLVADSTAILFVQARQISSLRQLVMVWIQKFSPGCYRASDWIQVLNCQRLTKWIHNMNNLSPEKMDFRCDFYRHLEFEPRRQRPAQPRVLDLPCTWKFREACVKDLRIMWQNDVFLDDLYGQKLRFTNL